ncbi:substrate-binding domain-containing protein [Aliagarivorans marinus]|uniref:substrate-binding domain-containing protein n=1 Tax=Aliagarivorans marinus TaxID=561965 RepID=UPI000403D7CA|nr:substrate-binding domain-containing protein [Aliagarivorans marinus]
MATIKDVAALAQVSTSTVSHVINQTRVVSDEATARVHQAIAELNYIPNTMARSLKGGGSQVLGMLVTDSTNPFYANLIQQVDRIAYQKGYNLILCNTHGEPNRAREYLDMLLQRRIDGLLVMSAEARLDGMELLQSRSNMPVVVMDWGPSNEFVDKIQDDSQFGGYLATRHLIENGHTDICCVMGPLQKSNSRQRLEGYQRAMQEAGLSVAEGHVVETSFSSEGGWQAMNQLIAQDRVPGAIFAGNDLIALGVIRAANEAGIRVPEQLSIVGYDDIPQAEFFSPSLSTIRQPVEQLASEAIELLMQRVAQPHRDKQTLKLRSQLISRSSVLASQAQR